jgi:hypothetical protein
VKQALSGIALHLIFFLFWIQMVDPNPNRSHFEATLPFGIGMSGASSYNRFHE